MSVLLCRSVEYMLLPQEFQPDGITVPTFGSARTADTYKQADDFRFTASFGIAENLFAPALPPSMDATNYFECNDMIHTLAFLAQNCNVCKGSIASACTTGLSNNGYKYLARDIYFYQFPCIDFRDIWIARQISGTTMNEQQKEMVASIIKADATARVLKNLGRGYETPPNAFYFCRSCKVKVLQDIYWYNVATYIGFWKEFTRLVPVTVLIHFTTDHRNQWELGVNRDWECYEMDTKKTHFIIENECQGIMCIVGKGMPTKRADFEISTLLEICEQEVPPGTCQHPLSQTDPSGDTESLSEEDFHQLLKFSSSPDEMIE